MHGAPPRKKNPLSSSIIGSHQLVILHPARKLLLPQRRRMRPRLQPILLPDRSREAARPLLPRKMPHHILNRPPVHQLRIAAHVVCVPFTHIVSAPLAPSFPSSHGTGCVGR